MTERNGPNIMAVSLLAGLTGAAVALLFAPRSGRETRERLRETATGLKDQASEGLDAARQSVESGVEKARDLRGKLGTKLAKTGRRAKQEIDDLSDDLQSVPKRQRQSSVLTNWEEEV